MSTSPHTLHLNAEALYANLLTGVRRLVTPETVLVGVWSGGAWLAERPVYLGGPVQTERGFVLHESLDDEGGHYNSTLKIEGGLEMTTSRDVLEALSNGAGPRKVFITLGYSGWTAGQLEEEISRNGWLNVDADPDVIFDTPVEQRYDKALSLLGIDRNFLMGEAGHA